MINHYKQTSTKNKIKAKSEQPQQQPTRKRQSVVRQETPSPHTTVNKEYRSRGLSAHAGRFECAEITKTAQAKKILTTRGL